jgi:hypothetical protein
MRAGRVQLGPVIALIGALMLVVSLFLDWWEGLTAFTAYELLDLVLVLLALATIVQLAGGMGLLRIAPPARSPGVTLAVTLFTLFVVLTQLINDPPAVVGSGRDHDIGMWLALAGAALMTVGAVLAFARISLAVDVHPRDEPTARTRPAPEPPPERPS